MAGEGTHEGFIIRQVGRSTRNLLVWNGLLLLLILFSAWFARNYFYNFFYGPFPLSDEDLTQLVEQRDGRHLLAYVDLGRRDLIPSGWREVTTVGDRPHTDFSYFLMPVEKNFLLVLARESDKEKPLVGPLISLRKLEGEVIASIEKEQPQTRGRIWPTLLNTPAAFPFLGYLALVLGGPLLLFSLFNIYRGMLRLANPRRHPLFADPAQAESIDRDMANPPIQEFGRWKLTRSWLLKETLFGLKMHRISDVVWFHESLTSRVPGVVLYLRSRKSVLVSVQGKDQTPLAEAVGQRAPWALSGFDRQLAETWKTRPEDIMSVFETRLDLPDQP